MTLQTALDYALAYAAHGWPVFPLHTPEADGRCSCRKPACDRVGKHPRTMNGLTGATCDGEQIKKWWEMWPGANVGVVTGARSGVAVIDIDPRHDGDTTMERLGDIPTTIESLTGSGGRHLIFKHVDGLRNTTGQLGPGVDTRAEGGYIVAPPSLHASGRRYEWEASTEFTDAPAEMPGWLVERLRHKAASGTAAGPMADQIIEGRRNHELTSIAGTMRRRGLSEDEIGAALEVVNRNRCRPPLPGDEVAAIAKSVGRYEPKAPLTVPRPPESLEIVEPDGSVRVVHPQSAKAVLELGPDEHTLNVCAIAALANHPEIYQRTGSLVRVARDAGSASLNRQPNSPVIAALPPAVLRSHLTQVAEFKKWSKTKQEWVDDHPWDFLVHAVHEYGEWSGIRSLESLTESPILRPDGTILSEPGYDAKTGVIYAPNCGIPIVSNNPSHQGAAAAAAELLDIVSEFPFATDAHRTAWLASLLTPLCRSAISSPAPIFAADANVRAAGKSMLMDLVSLLINGRRMARMIYSSDDDEMRKRITSIAMEGDPLVLVDNIVGPFGGAALDAALTSLLWSDRSLGTNKIVRVPLVATWFATGNNLQFQGDLARRTLHIRLESPEENPEERSGFKHPDLLAYVSNERPRLLSCALTILRAYCAAGRPDQGLKAWGSFESWSSLVRGAIVWCGLADPGETRAALAQASDTDANALVALLHGWRELGQDDGGLSCADAIRRLEDNPRMYQTARTAILEVCPTRNGQLPSSKALGCALRKFRNRVVDGIRFDSSIDRNGISVWRVVDSETRSAA